MGYIGAQCGAVRKAVIEDWTEKYSSSTPIVGKELKLESEGLTTKVFMRLREV